MSKITHENIKKVVSRTYNALVYYFNDDNALEFEREIQDYIKQQERDSKLLELYKEALETNFEGITLIKLVNKTLRTQIEELENE